MRTSFYFRILSLALIPVWAPGCNNSPKSEQKQTDSIAGSLQNSEINKSIQYNPAEKVFRVLANVTEINEADSTITIAHEKMEGFMQAMEMPYKVEDLSIFKQIRVGTEGHFTIKFTGDEGVITHVHVHHK